MNEKIKKGLMILVFGIIAYLCIIFIISTGILLIVLIIAGLAMIGAYDLWEKYAKTTLLTKEEPNQVNQEEK